MYNEMGSQPFTHFRETAMNPQTQADAAAAVADDQDLDNKASFAETALKLGGKSDDEARRTGAIDTADDQVETAVRQAVSDGQQPGPPRRVGSRAAGRAVREPARRTTPPDVQRVMDDSLDRGAQARQGRHATWTTNKKVPQNVLDDLGEAGYWGLLVDKQYGGSGSPFASFAAFLTQMAMVDPTVAGLASVHGCIGAVDPVRTFGNAEQKQRFLPRAGQRRAAVRLRPDRARRRLRPDGAAHHGRRSTATTTSSTARSCSSPTSCPAARSAWCA